MLHFVSGLTGAGDAGRCPFRVRCNVRSFLRPSGCASGGVERTVEVMSGEWELAVWTLAGLSARYGDKVICRGGDAYVSCPACRRSIPFSTELTEDAGVVFCRDASCVGADKPVYFITDISATNVTEGVNAARREAGGVRGYPMLRGVETRMQSPVLHCTGKNAKRVILLILSSLSEELEAKAKIILLALTAKGQMDNLYLREFRELVAAAIACPEVFSDDLDVVFSILLQLMQLMNASWRSSLTEATGRARRGAASITRLAACIMGPLHEVVKPLDPVTKNANVRSLYLHTPISHLHEQVGDNRADVAFVSDDNIEGHLRGIGRFLHNHGNNAPHATLLADFTGLQQAILNFSTPRSQPSSLIFLKTIHLCECWRRLGDTGRADFDAISAIGRDDPELELQERDDGKNLVFELPLRDQVEDNGARRRQADGSPVIGKKEALRPSLRIKQATIVACFCGSLTGGENSAVMQLVADNRVAIARKAAMDKDRNEKGGMATPLQPTGAASTSSAATTSFGQLANVRTMGTSGVAPMLVSTPGDALGGRGVLSTSGPRSDGSADGVSKTSGRSAVPRVSSSKARRDAIVAGVPGHMPPVWLLAELFTGADFFSTLVPSGREVDAVPTSEAARVSSISEHIIFLRLFLMRSKTYAFASWAAKSAVDWNDMVEAAKVILRRLVALRGRAQTVVDAVKAPLSL